MMPVPSRPVPRVEHETDFSSPDCSQYSDCSDGEQYYDEEEHYEGEETNENNTEECAQESAGGDMESNSDSSCVQTQQEELSEKEVARIQHRTCVVKEILSVTF